MNNWYLPIFRHFKYNEIRWKDEIIHFHKSILNNSSQMLKRPINKLVLENDLLKTILMVILRLEFEQDPLHASVGSRWVHDLLRKKIKIICFYTQNDE